MGDLDSGLEGAESAKRDETPRPIYETHMYIYIYIVVIYLSLSLYIYIYIYICIKFLAAGRRDVGGPLLLPKRRGTLLP